MTTAPRPAQISSQPRRLGDYEILAPINAGGMGVVYRARHLQTDEVVALNSRLPALAAELRRLDNLCRQAPLGHLRDDP